MNYCLVFIKSSPVFFPNQLIFYRKLALTRILLLECVSFFYSYFYRSMCSSFDIWLINTWICACAIYRGSKKFTCKFTSRDNGRSRGDGKTARCNSASLFPKYEAGAADGNLMFFPRALNPFFIVLLLSSSAFSLPSLYTGGSI